MIEYQNFDDRLEYDYIDYTVSIFIAMNSNFKKLFGTNWPRSIRKTKIDFIMTIHKLLM